VIHKMEGSSFLEKMLEHMFLFKEDGKDRNMISMVIRWFSDRCHGLRLLVARADSAQAHGGHKRGLGAHLQVLQELQGPRAWSSSPCA
jgi:hypothetical protein